MYRGSSFLLQHDYKIHIKVVEYFLTGDTPKSLWISSQKDTPFYDNPKNINMLIEACKEVRRCYPERDKRPLATNTLVTKVLMGALGCVPAYDRYVVESIKEAGLVAFPLGKDDNFELIQQSILQISNFYFDNAFIFQQVTMKPQGFYYPPMKIMDMVLWKMSFRKSVAQKILSMPSSQNKGKAKARRSVEEDKAVSDWLQGSGSVYSGYFKNGVLKPIKKKKRHSKKWAKRYSKKNYQELFESFADSLCDPQKKIFLNTVPDEE